MRARQFLLFAMLFCQACLTAQGFEFERDGRKRIVIPFDHLNNLVIIPVEVNGVMLNFLLDSGVDETILFSLDDREVSFGNLEKILFRGLGSAEPIEGLKSGGNIVSINGLRDPDHDIYIVLDQGLNFSGSIGVPVNGIIGHHFFKNFPVEIDYARKRIVVHRDAANNLKKWNKSHQVVPISVEAGKPYLHAEVTIANEAVDSKLLIDVGNSDAIWLFAGRSPAVQIPHRSFADYLGRGFSGEIHGRRARIAKFKLAGHEFEYPIVAFPDSTSTKSIKLVEDRVGSVGGEILRRFSVILDYRAGKMYLRKNANFDAPFQYNMSGLEIQHGGMTWVKETVESAQSSNLYNIQGERIPNTFTFKFELKPIYTISNVRETSPAWDSGLRSGDELVSINNRSAYRFTLQQINNLLKSEDGKTFKIKVERDGKPLEFTFRLKSML